MLRASTSRPQVTYEPGVLAVSDSSARTCCVNYKTNGSLFSHINHTDCHMSYKQGEAWRLLCEAGAADTLGNLKIASTPGLTFRELRADTGKVKYGDRSFMGRKFSDIIKQSSYKFATIMIGSNDEDLFNGEGGTIKEKVKDFLCGIKTVFDHWSFECILISTVFPRGSANPALDLCRRDVELRKEEFNATLQSLVKSQARFRKTQGGYATLRVIDMSGALPKWDELNRSLFCIDRPLDYIHFNAKTMTRWVILVHKALNSTYVTYHTKTKGKFIKGRKKINFK